MLWSAACAREAPKTAAAPPPTPPDRLEDTVVLAIVEQLHRQAHEEWLEGYPNVLVSDLVAFAIVQPERLESLLFAHVRGHPRIDGRPLLLGDAVTFVLPVHWRNRDLALADLEGLAFAATTSGDPGSLPRVPEPARSDPELAAPQNLALRGRPTSSR